jgi:hypothetical protein
MTKPKWTKLTSREIEILRIIVHQEAEKTESTPLDELFNKLTKILDEMEDKNETNSND